MDPDYELLIFWKLTPFKVTLWAFSAYKKPPLAEDVILLRVVVPDIERVAYLASKKKPPPSPLENRLEIVVVPEKVRVITS